MIPGQQNYSPGTYYLRFQSSVDRCRLRCVAVSTRYIPTTDQAIRGPGAGFRPGILEKKNNIGRTVIRPAMKDSERRKKFGQAGFFPLTGDRELRIPLPYYLRGRREPSPGAAPLSSSGLQSSGRLSRPLSAASVHRPFSAASHTQRSETGHSHVSHISTSPREDHERTMKLNKGPNVSYLEHTARPSSPLERVRLPQLPITEISATVAR